MESNMQHQHNIQISLFIAFTFYDPAVGDPKDLQLRKLANALKGVLKNGWNIFDFSYIELKKIFDQKFEKYFWGYPHFGP